MKNFKLLIATVVATLLAMPLSAQSFEIDWYGFGGLSAYQKDVDTAVGTAPGFQLGIGTQLSRTFGVEFVYQQAPPIDPEEVVKYLTEEGWSFSDYTIETYSNRYFSALGTVSYPFPGTSANFVGKLGIAYYRVEANMNLTNLTTLLNDNPVTLSIDTKDKGTTPLASLGVLFPFGKRDMNDLELSLTHMFKDEVKATSLNCTFRRRF